eukprot:1744401-Pyramimonas_sp.AAC.1
MFPECSLNARARQPMEAFVRINILIHKALVPDSTMPEVGPPHTPYTTYKDRATSLGFKAQDQSRMPVFTCKRTRGGSEARDNLEGTSRCAPQREYPRVTSQPHASRENIPRSYKL